MRNHVILVPVGLLLLATAHLPYGYYTFLRLAVTLSAGLLAWQAFDRSRSIGPAAVAFGLLVLLFNPVAPVYLHRETWFFIDLAASAIFAVQWYRSGSQL